MRKFNCIVRNDECSIMVSDLQSGSSLNFFEYRKSNNSFFWMVGIDIIAVPNLFDISEEDEFQYMIVHDDSLGLTLEEMKEVQRQMISYSSLPKYFVQNVYQIYV
ncbi:hypothetical protein GNZ01_07350 [Escherichia coli]|uniref:Uncharacterized protein n=1 Tax=Escherichia coli TaxID=562 RepID=A0AAJ3CXH6_ECOLX|nr:hypothetical protein [Escherichia coli]MUM71710.1 hypothetical protein [Escherichia coli]MUM83067.1 hypothetical protein [Escherichia coli]